MSNLQNSLKWSAIERIATQGVQLLTMLILSRILGPEAYGLIAMLSIVIAVSQIFVDSGFSSALIRKKKPSESDFSTVFFFNLGVSCFLCFLIVFISKYISDFYGEPDLSCIIKVLSFVLIINSFSLVPKTKLIIEMNFKLLSKITMLSVLLSSGVAIIVAYHGAGVWTLVIQSLIYSSLIALCLYLHQKWHPKFIFNLDSFHELFGFGYKLLLSSIIDTIYKNIYQVVIGKFYSVQSLGIFSQSMMLTQIPSSTFSQIVQRVNYPALSKIQDDPIAISDRHKTSIELSILIFFPLMFCLIISSKSLIFFILGDKWMGASEYISILAFGFMLYPIHALNLNILNVMGRSDLFLKLEIFKKIIATVILLFSVPYGIKYMCIGITLESFFQLYINTMYINKFSSFTFIKQIRFIFQVLLISSISFYLAWMKISYAPYELLNMVFSVFIGLSCYIFLSFVFLNKVFNKIINGFK